MDNRRGALFILAGAILWGTTGTAQALAPAGARPLAVGALRLVIGGLFLLLIYALSRHSAVPPADGLRSRLSLIPILTTAGPTPRLPLLPILIAAGCMAAYQVLFFAGVRLTGVAVGTIVGIGSSPVLAGLLGWVFRGERLSRRWGIATLLALAGCALLVLTGSKIQINPLGMLLAVGAGGAYATFSLVTKRLLETQPVEQIMALAFCLGAVLLAPLLLTQDLSWLAEPNGLGAMLWLGIAATALAYTLFGKGLQRTPLASAVTLTLAEPLTAGLLGLLVLGESVTSSTALGMLLILSGLVILSARHHSASKHPLAT